MYLTTMPTVVGVLTSGKEVRTPTTVGIYSYL